MKIKSIGGKAAARTIGTFKLLNAHYAAKIVESSNWFCRWRYKYLIIKNERIIKRLRKKWKI